jgi:ABC-type lipoprotein release transport system permease subunit
MLNPTTPPGLFAIISRLMIVVTVIVTGLTQASFFRQSIIDRDLGNSYKMSVTTACSQESKFVNFALKKAARLLGPK